MSARADSTASASPSMLRAWDLLPASVLLLAPDGRALGANRAFADATDIPAGALQGDGWLSLMGPRCRRSTAYSSRRRRDFSLALRLQRPLPEERDESERPPPAAWFTCTARWLPEQGHYLCVLHDQSAARRAARAARAQAEQVQLLADHVPALIATYDVRTRQCLFANKRYALSLIHI